MAGAMAVDLNAPIVPDRGLGGITLRTPLRAMRSLVEPLLLQAPGRVRMVGLFEVEYTLADGAVGLSVDVRNGKVFRIAARRGYCGSLLDGIVVGMGVRAAMQREPRLYYSEAEGTILLRGVVGVSLDIADPDPDLVDVPAGTIEGISVWAKEILTRSGQDGHW
jgi:hypothetical protein